MIYGNNILAPLEKPIKESCKTCCHLQELNNTGHSWRLDQAVVCAFEHGVANLDDYSHCTVDVFNRSGQQLFHSVGYPVARDGTYGGKTLPFDTYYYVIDL